MKKTYSVSLPMEIIEELRSKYGFKISEDISIIVEEKLKELQKKSHVNVDTLMLNVEKDNDLPTWFDNIGLFSYKKIKNNPDKYFRWLKESYGDFDPIRLMEYLDNKYKKEGENGL